MARLVCISDTHNQHPHIKVPGGDVLIHAGDITSRGSAAEMAKFGEWLRVLPHKYKIVICGNHDFIGEDDPDGTRRLLADAIYLQDSSVDICGLKIFGSAWTPYFGGWAFNLPRGPMLADKWAEIPEDVEVVVTHGPPMLIGDQVHGEGTLAIENVGCSDLAARLRQLPKLKAHVYGHIHDGHGLRTINGIHYVNAAVLNDRYQIAYSPIVLDL